MKSRVHPTYKTQYHVQNWAASDRALVCRGDITIWVSPAAIAAWDPDGAGPRGAPRTYSDLAIESALTLRLLFHLPRRQTAGCLTALFGLRGLDLRSPDHTTLSRRGQHRFFNLLPHLDTPPARTLSQSSVQENSRAQESLRGDVGAERFQTPRILAGRHTDQHLVDHAPVQRVRIRACPGRWQRNLLAGAPRTPASFRRGISFCTWDALSTSRRDHAPSAVTMGQGRDEHLFPRTNAQSFAAVTAR